MGLRQTPPGEGGKRGYVHFPYVKTRRGEKWNAWMAGRIHWFTCHEGKRTKPCLHAISDGELTCSSCTGQVPTRVMGYVPLYRELDARPCMVLVYDEAREELDKRRLHERVIIGRGNEVSDTVYVLRAMQQTPAYQSSIADRMRPADLSCVLLRVWQMPELSQWFTITEGRPVPVPKPKPSESDNPVSLPEKIAEGGRGNLGDYIDLALGKASDRVKRSQKFADDAKAEAAKEKAKPSANGNGKH